MNHEHGVDIVKIDDRDYSVVCHQCGNTFEARRSDAAFCSARCRVAFSREPAKLQNQIEGLGWMGKQVIAAAEKYKNNNRVYEAVKELHRVIGVALTIFEQE